MKKNAILLMAVVSLFVSNKQMANAEDNTATQKDSTGISVDSLEKMSDKELESMTQVPHGYSIWNLQPNADPTIGMYYFFNTY